MYKSAALEVISYWEKAAEEMMPVDPRIRANLELYDTESKNIPKYMAGITGLNTGIAGSFLASELKNPSVIKTLGGGALGALAGAGLGYGIGAWARHAGKKDLETKLNKKLELSNAYGIPFEQIEGM